MAEWIIQIVRKTANKWQSNCKAPTYTVEQVAHD